MKLINSYNLNVIQDVLNKSHPKQIINKVGDFKISLFEIKYSYNTNRGNSRNGVKYILNNTLNPQLDYNTELNNWVNEYNKNNKHRQISNVKFLEGQCLGYICI